MFFFCSPCSSFTSVPVSDCEPSSPTNFNGHVVKMHQHVPGKAGNRRRYLSQHFLTNPELYLQKQQYVTGKENSFLSCIAG